MLMPYGYRLARETEAVIVMVVTSHSILLM